MLYEVRNISKSFGRNTVIEDFSLEVNKGDMIAVVGSKGCGKTTLSQMLAGIEKVSSGVILAGNRVISKRGSSKGLLRLRRRAITYLPSEPVFIPEMTIYDNILLTDTRSKGGSKNKKAKAKEILKIVGLKGKGRFFVKELTPLERYRAGLARAILNNPMMIIADDPSGYLDGYGVNQVMSDFEMLNDNGVTIVIVTKSKKVASRCYTVVAMDDEIDIEDFSAKAIAEEDMAEYSDEFEGIDTNYEYGDEEYSDEYDESEEEQEGLDQFTVDMDEMFEGEAEAAAEEETADYEEYSDEDYPEEDFDEYSEDEENYDEYSDEDYPEEDLEEYSEDEEDYSEYEEYSEEEYDEYSDDEEYSEEDFDEYDDYQDEEDYDNYSDEEYSDEYEENSDEDLIDDLYDEIIEKATEEALNEKTEGKPKSEDDLPEIDLTDVF